MKKNLLNLAVIFFVFSCGTENKSQNTPIETKETVFDDCGFDNQVIAEYYPYHTKTDSIVHRDFKAEHTHVRLDYNGSIVFIASDQPLGDSPMTTSFKDKEQSVIMIKINNSHIEGDHSEIPIVNSQPSQIQIQGYGTFYDFTLSNTEEELTSDSEQYFLLEKLDKNSVCIKINLVLNRKNRIYKVNTNISAEINEDNRD